MGVFNEQSSNQHYQFAKGIQGAPGVGFNLTAEGKFDITNKRLTNVADGTDPSDAVTKKQLDNISGTGDVTSDIDLKDTYNVINSKRNTFQELKNKSETLVNFEEVRENFIGIYEAFLMKTYLDMGDILFIMIKHQLTLIKQQTKDMSTQQ